MHPIDALCAALFRHGICVTPDVLQAALADTGQTLSHGVRGLVQDHLDRVRRLGKEVANAR